MKKFKKLLIDGDIILYQQAYIHEIEIIWEWPHKTYYADVDVLKTKLDNYISNLLSIFDYEDYQIYLTGNTNFRKDILPSYKEHRKDYRKPEGFKEAKEYLIDNYNAIIKEPFEADDLIGIAASYNYDNVVISTDKDFETIPANIYNPIKRTFKKISEKEANRNWMYQTMIGDTADNFKGAVGVGKVKANKILDNIKKGESTSDIIIKEAFKGDSKDFWIQAKCARILRSTDIDKDFNINYEWNTE